MYSINENYIKKYGSNYWNIIHIEALKITLQELTDCDVKQKRTEFLAFFEYIIKNMMCSCKNHAYQIFMINRYADNYKYMFQYTVDFHNEVNLRLNKPIISYKQAVFRYKDIIDKT